MINYPCCIGVDGEETVKRRTERGTFGGSVLRRAAAVPLLSCLRGADRVLPLQRTQAAVFDRKQGGTVEYIYASPLISQG